MKRSFGLSILGTGLAALLSLSMASQATAAGEGQGLLAEAQKTFKKLPDKMPGSEKDTEAKVAAGQKAVQRAEDFDQRHPILQQLPSAGREPWRRRQRAHVAGRGR